MNVASSRGEWKAGWPVVLAGGAGATSLVIPVISLASLIKPLSANFGWSRAEITSGALITAVSLFVLGGLIGRGVDRFGARRVALTSVLLFPFGLIVIGLSGPSVWTWYAAWTLLALLGPGLAPSIWAMAVTTRFDRSRGLALGVMMCGMGLLYLVVPSAA